MNTNSPIVPTPHYRVNPDDLVVIEGEEHILVSTDANGHVLELRARPGCHVSFTHDHYKQFVDDGKAEKHKGYFSPSRAYARNFVAWQPLSALPDRISRKTVTYADAFDIYLQMRVEWKAGTRNDGRAVNTGDESLSWVIPEIENELRRRQKAFSGRGGKLQRSIVLPGARHFRRKLKTYLEGGCDARVLDDRAGGAATRNRVTDMREYEIRRKHQVAYASKNRPTIAALRREYFVEMDALNLERGADGLAPVKAVSRKTFDNGIKKLDQFHVNLARHGEEAARKQAEIGVGGIEAEYPLQRVEMDEWKVDLMVLLTDLGVWEKMTLAERAVVEKSRLWATVIIDVATRCILSMKVYNRAPNSTSAIAALEMAMMDKTYLSDVVGAGSPWIYHGRLEEVYTDAGKAFMSHECRMAMLDAGVSHVHPVTGVPQLRAYIERFFRTCSEQFLHWFSGRTFSDYITKGDYDPQENASLCIDEFNRSFVRALVDIYHHRKHEGLAGETPHNAWLRLTRSFGVEQPPSREERRYAFGINCEAKISNEGIRCMGLHYRSDDLRMIRKAHGNAKVQFRVDRFDLSAISVRHEGRWFSVPSAFPVPENLTVWEWTTACADLRKIHAANAVINSAIVHKAVADLRVSGESAMMMAELGTPTLDAEYINQQERQIFRGLNVDLSDPVQSSIPLLDLTANRFSSDNNLDAAAAKPHRPDFLSERYKRRGSKDALYNHDEALPVTPSQFGGADGIEFED